MSQLLQIINVKKRYIKDKHYNLEINNNDFILLTGLNGSGKSTLIKLVLNFIHPDGGKIIRAKNLKLAFLPERINIPLNRSIAKLSKGNRQKVAIFTTLLNNKDLIILDEPLNGLDNETIKIVKAKITELYNKGTSFLVSTHLKNTFKNLATKEYSLC